MIQKDLFGNVISSPQDTHVNRSQSQGDKKEKKTLDTSIRTYLKLLHPKDPLGSFSKTLAVTSHWASTRCLLTWHLKTTPQGYLLFQLRPSALPTEEIESGSSDEMWATPNTMDHLPQRSEESTKKDAGRASEGKDQTEQSQGTGGRGDNEDVPNTESQQRNERHNGISDKESGQSGVRIETGTSSGNVAHTESQRTGTNDEGIWQRSGRTGGGEGTAMAHTISEGLEGRIGNSQGGERKILSTEQHNRDEVWSASGRTSGKVGEGQEQNFSDSDSQRLQGSEQSEAHSRQASTQYTTSKLFKETRNSWAVEPDVGRVAHGVPRRVDRLKGLGNAIVPQIAMQIGLAIKQEIEK